MKCPKCQYLGFDNGGRCRNCGYDFSLVDDRPPFDLPIQTGDEAEGAIADFALEIAPPTLPLFSRDEDLDAPLVSPGAAPRAPLSVRRGAPTTRPRPRLRTPEHVEPRLALDTAEFNAIPVAAPPPTREPIAARSARASEAPAPAGEIAATGPRVLAACIDLLLLAGIDLAVLYFTLRICDLPWPLLRTLPIAPLLSFLVLLNGGYLAIFIAATGQTIGKMAAHIRVVPADPGAPAGERVPFGRALLRAVGYVMSAVPLGLGFVPGIVGQKRTLHDRLSDTRVVRA